MNFESTRLETMPIEQHDMALEDLFSSLSRDYARNVHNAAFGPLFDMIASPSMSEADREKLVDELVSFQNKDAFVITSVVYLIGSLVEGCHYLSRRQEAIVPALTALLQRETVLVALKSLLKNNKDRFLIKHIIFSLVRMPEKIPVSHHSHLVSDLLSTINDMDDEVATDALRIIASLAKSAPSEEKLLSEREEEMVTQSLLRVFNSAHDLKWGASLAIGDLADTLSEIRREQIIGMMLDSFGRDDNSEPEIVDQVIAEMIVSKSTPQTQRDRLLNKLLLLFKHEFKGQRKDAVFTMIHVDPTALSQEQQKKVISGLKQLIEDENEDEEVKEHAISALKVISEGAFKAQEELLASNLIEPSSSPVKQVSETTAEAMAFTELLVMPQSLSLFEQNVPDIRQPVLDAGPLSSFSSARAGLQESLSKQTGAALADICEGSQSEEAVAEGSNKKARFF